MARMQERVVRAGEMMGLNSQKGRTSAFGCLSGIDAQLLLNRDLDFVGILRWYDIAKDDAIRTRFSTSKSLKSARIKRNNIKVKDGTATYTVKRNAFGLGALSQDEIVKRIQSIVAEIKSELKDLAPPCRLCGASAPQPVLLNDVVDRVCNPCLAKVQLKAREEATAYEVLPLHWLRAFSVGVILMIIGMIAWIAVIVSTERMFWLVAMLIGFVIAWITSKAAGKGAISVQILSGGLAFFAVAGGTLMMVALAALDASVQNDVLNAALFGKNFMEFISESAGDIAFSTGGGLIGAVVAAQIAGKPKFAVSIER